jgi:uncharacterized linocin/CFP29 family protein
MNKTYTRMQKQVVNDTRLARKMYPDFTDNEDGTITIEVEVISDGFGSGGILTATDVQDAINDMLTKGFAAPSEIIVNPKQYAELQKLIDPDDMDIKVSNYCPDDKVYIK